MVFALLTYFGWIRAEGSCEVTEKLENCTAGIIMKCYTVNMFDISSAEVD